MITALITHYNKPPHILKRCVDSVVACGIPYVIVDDGSDRDISDLKQYTNVMYLKENIGTYKAFRAGLKHIHTKYVMRVDADDYISGIPDVSDEYDAYINNVDNKITLDIGKFMQRPYTGFNGATVKKTVLLEMWFSDVRYYGDIINFARLLRGYKCKMNDTCLYVYDKEFSNITVRKDRQKHIEYAKKIMRQELEDGR